MISVGSTKEICLFTFNDTHELPEMAIKWQKIGDFDEKKSIFDL